MSKVFISYAQQDRPTAEAMARLVAGHGYNVWWDRELLPGNTYADIIEQELDQAAVVIVIWSEFSRKSFWVRDEAAVGRDRNRLVPVSLDDNAPPLGFRQIQTVPLSGWNGQDGRVLSPLWRSLSGLLGGAQAPQTPAPAPEADASLEPARRSNVIAGVNAQPNNKPLKTILKEEKRQRGFIRTFWLTSFVISGVLSIVIGVFAGQTQGYKSGGFVVNALAGLMWVGVALVIGRSLIVVGRRLSRRKSIRYFDGPTIICLGVSVVTVAAASLLRNVKSVSGLDDLFTGFLIAAALLPFVALVSVVIGFFKGLNRKTYEDGQ